MNIKELVKDKRVIFVMYRKNELWYKVEGTDFLFPVPIADTGDGTFLSSDKAILMMRYIRKQLEEIKKVPK